MDYAIFLDAILVQNEKLFYAATSRILGYLPHCSLSCSCNDPKVLKKHQHTTLSRFGTRWPMQSSEVLEKSKHSCKEKYGVNNVSQSDAIKQQKADHNYEKFWKRQSFQQKESSKKHKLMQQMLRK